MLKQKESVKHLGVYLDRSLNYQDEVKNILRKMAWNIKTIYYHRDFLPGENSISSIKFPCDQSSPVFIGFIEQYLLETNFDFGKTIEKRVSTDTKRTQPRT